MEFSSQESQPYKRIGITQDSKILIAESGFKWPWKASILPNAKKAFIRACARSSYNYTIIVITMS